MSTSIITPPHLFEPHPYTDELVTLRHVAQVNWVCLELKTLFRQWNRISNSNGDFPKPSVLKRRTNSDSDSDHTEASEEEGERVVEPEATTPVYNGYVYSTVDYFGIPREIPRLYDPEDLKVQDAYIN